MRTGHKTGGTFVNRHIVQEIDHTHHRGLNFSIDNLVTALWSSPIGIALMHPGKVVRVPYSQFGVIGADLALDDTTHIRHRSIAADQNIERIRIKSEVFDHKGLAVSGPVHRSEISMFPVLPILTSPCRMPPRRVTLAGHGMLFKVNRRHKERLYFIGESNPGMCKNPCRSKR